MLSKAPSELVKKSVVTIRTDIETEINRASRSSTTAAKLKATYASRTSRDYSSILKAGAASRKGSTFESFSTTNSPHSDDGSKEDDEEMGSEEHSNEEEESSQECNEDEDECEEEEEEDGEEEQVEEEETTEASSLEISEPDLDLEMRRRLVIERYLSLLQRLRYTRKNNAYLDDKLYKLCVRKGYIIEQDDSQNQDDDSQNKHHRGRKKQHIVLHIHSRDDLRKQASKTIAVKSQNSLGTPINSGPRSKSRVFLTSVRNQEKLYRKKLEHLIALGKTEVEIAETVTYHLAQLEEKFKEKEAECTGFFDTLMGRMTEESSQARHSNMGTPLNPSETRQFVEEIRSYFNKLRRTIHLFYKTWHGLNFDLEKLEEHEVKEKGLSMLEFEQLQAENRTLKDKAEYQETELEKQRKKIASALQILAHVREKEFRIDDLLIVGFNNLNKINSQLKVYAEQMDDVTQSFAALRGEQRELQQQSGLMDNVKLMRDYEKTTGKLSQVKEEKRKIVMQTNGNAHEIQELQNQISLIKQNLPQLQKMAAKRAQDFKRESEVKRAEEEQRVKEHQDVEQFKVERLLELLQLRHDEPWKEVQERLIRPDFFSAAGNLPQMSC